MINLFIIRKWAALLSGPLLTVIFFFVGLKFYGFWWAFGLMLISLLLSCLLGNLLLKNPFTSMLEGQGLLTLSMDSPGIIKPFLVGLEDPYITGKIGKQPVKDIFDRAAVFQLSAPLKAEATHSTNKDGVKTISFTPKDVNENRFAFLHYPVLIWNNQLGQFLTKDFFANKEKDYSSEHGVLYLNRLVEDLNKNLRDFGRYIVEQLKPHTSILANKYVIIAIVIAVVIIIIMFAPAILKAAQGAGGGSGAISNLLGGGAITPK